MPSLQLGYNKLKNCDNPEKQQEKAQRITERRKSEREREQQEAISREYLKFDFTLGSTLWKF